jgi:hypothetical protein
MYKWNDDEPDQSGNKKSDPEIHDRFNHGTYASSSRALIEKPSALASAGPADGNTSPKPRPRREDKGFRLSNSRIL